MISKIKKIIIFIIVAGALVFGFLFFTKKTPDDTNLTSSSPVSPNPSTGIVALNQNSQNSLATQDFLTILLNVKSIKLDDAIFSDPAFATLRDSSIVLIPDGTEGRPNPFAPIGFERITAPIIPPSTIIPSPSTEIIVPKN